MLSKYCKTFNIWRTLVGIKIVDHSDEVGASSAGAAPTTSSLTRLGEDNRKTRRETFKFWNLVGLILKVWR